MQQRKPFEANITNEQTAALGAARFGGEIVVVDTDRAVVAACKELASHRMIGFDTETRPSFRVGVTNRVALLQLSTFDRCYLFRLCRIRFDRAIVRLLEDRNLLKVGAAVAGDVASLHQIRRFREAGFVDLQSIAADWGVEEKSLRKMSALVMGLRVSKAQRLSNWEAANLTPQQQMYAATDAWICLKIYEKLLITPKNLTTKRYDSASPSAQR